MMLVAISKNWLKSKKLNKIEKLTYIKKSKRPSFLTPNARLAFT